MSDNTASNLGTGQGIFAQKVGVDLQFKGLVGGTGITLTADANNITIASTGSTSAVNLGTGSGLFTTKSGSNLQFKTLIANADSGISLTSNSNDLTLQLVSANVDAGKLGGVAASDYLRKSDNLLSVASAATARTNLSVYSKAEIDANVIRNNQNVLPTTDSTWSLGSNSYKWLNIYADNFYGRASVAGSIGELSDIGNVDLTGKVQDDIIKYNAVSGNWETGKLSFLTLSDTPTNYTGAANKYVKVNSAGDGIEFVTGLATETYVTDQINALVGGAPGALDTLNELAEALNDNADFHTTITNNLAGKENTITAGTTAQYFRGDKTFQTLDSDAVAEGSTNKYVTASNMGTISVDALSDVQTTGSNAPSDGQALVWDNIGGYWKPGTVSGGGGGGGSGDITSVVAGTGLTGGASSGAATLNVDVGTGANKIVQLDGSGRLPAVDGSQLTGVSTATTIAALTDTTIGTPSNGEVLFYNGSAWVDQALTTDNISEGANLYYTDTRADARITNALIDEDNMASNSATRLPSQQSVKAYVDAQVASKDNTDEITEGSTNLYFTNTRADARADARIGAASLTDLSNVDAVVAGDDGKILYYDHSTTSFKWKTESGALADTDALSEGSTNLYFTNARADARITAAGSANWNTAYGWGDHGSAGYQTTAGLNGAIDTHLNQSNPTSGYVLSWNGSDYAWVANGTGGITDIVNDATPQLGGTLDANGNTIDMGTNVITDAKVGQWDTAYGWGDHGSAGYLTSVPAQSFASLTGKPTTIAGYGITDLNASIDAHLNQSNPTSGYVLSWNGSDYAWVTNAGYTNTDFDNRLATKDTDDISEGSTNQYFTNARADARADARIGAANINALANVHTAAPTDGQVLKWDNGNSRWAPANDTDTVYTSFNTDFDTRLATKSTTNLTEGTNLYFTNARADARIAAATTDDVTEGSSNLYYTDARARAAISEGSTQLSYNSGTGVLTFTQGDTDTVAEGSSNLYYTSTRANTDFDTRLATKDTGDLAEGSNLYYTDTRADARITAALIDEDNMASNSATRIPSQQSVKAYVDSQVASENEISEMNDVTITSIQNNDFLKYNSSTSRWENATVTPATAAGSNTYVQFNDGGVMGGDAGITFNKTTNDLTVTGKILYSNVYSAEGDLPSASTYHGMFAHVHGTGKGYFAHGGNWIKLIDETSSTTTNLTEGTNLYYTDARARAAISESSSQLSYNSSTGVLTFTQDDTDGITEGSTNLYFTNARADARITAALIDEDNMASDSATRLPSQQSVKAYVDSSTANSSNWDTAYGWGDHGSAGYQTTAGLNGAIDTHLNQSNPTSGYVLSWNGSDYAWVSNAGYSNSDVDAHLNQSNPTSGHVLSWNGSDYAWVAQSGGIALTDLSVGAEGSASGNGAIAYNSGSGVFTYTPPVLSGLTGDTDDISEGSTNLYFTNARADARIGAADLADLSNVHTASPTDGQVLTWDNGNSRWAPATPSGGGSSLTVQDEGSALATAATTINFVGAGVTASGTGATKTITISGGGSSGTEYEEFKINYATNGNISTISDTTSGISGVTIDSATGGDVTVTFTGYTTPPLSVMFYGYNYPSNEYNMNTLGSTGTTLRKVPGGGSSGSPTAFGSFATLQIKVREAETGASRSFGTTTHAWVRFVMGA